MNEKVLFALNMVATKCVNFIRGNKLHRKDIHRIVCVKLDEIGDMATCVHVFESLKIKYPNAHISVVCEPFVRSLIHHDPNIDSILKADQLIGLKADLWLELRGTWRSLFYSLISGAKIRLDRGTIRFRQRGNQAHEYFTNFNIIEPLGCEQKAPKLYPGQGEELTASEWIQKWGSKPFAIIHAGGRRELRQWSPLKFAEITDLLYQKYGIISILLGAENEKEILETICKNSKSNSIIWTNKDSLLVFYAVVKKAALFVGNESGPLQIADIANVPCIGLFGPGVPNVFYPRNAHSRVLHEVLSCNPCDQIHCVHPENPCIQRISVEKVTQQIQEIL